MMDSRYLEIPDALAGDRRLTIASDNEGTAYHVVAPVCALRPEPDEAAGADTQLIIGEDFIVHEEQDDWLKGQASRDKYVGWVRRNHVKQGTSGATHHIVYHGSFLYSEPDLKSRPVMKMPMGARLEVMGEEEVRGTSYLKVQDGWVFKGHLREVDAFFSDFVAVGETTIGMTYLWGGRSPFGIDCSGLIQLCMQMVGIAVFRDSDMQELTIGEEVSLNDDLSGLRRGDLIYWPGHCGIMRDETTLLHANGHTMTVASEPLSEAVKRIAYLYDLPRSIKRPFALSAAQD